MTIQFQRSILGGTFDHFHIGHEAFISEAFKSSKHVAIGIVVVPFSHDKAFSSSIQSLDVRSRNLTNFLRRKGLLSRTTIIQIHDMFGTTLTDKTIDAIFVTESTIHNATIINNKRKILNMPILQIISVAHVLADDGERVSSSRIREGIIDRLGYSYHRYLLQKSTYHLPIALRKSLQTPLGKVFANPKDTKQFIPPTSTIITVGDIVSVNLIKIGYTPAVSVIDYRSHRQNLDQKEIAKYLPSPVHSLTNPPGTISSKFANHFLATLDSFFKNRSTQVIAVDGEEDLLVIPAILLAPLGSFIIYGQYNVGACLVPVTEIIKSEVKSLLSNFG